MFNVAISYYKKCWNVGVFYLTEYWETLGVC